RLEIARLLLLGPVRDDRGPGHAEPDHTDVSRRLRRGELLVQNRLEAVRRPGAAVLLRPGQPGVAGLVQLAAPLADERILEPLRATAPSALLRGEVGRDPSPELVAKPRLVGRVPQVHEREANPWRMPEPVRPASPRRRGVAAPAAASRLRGSPQRR